VSEALAQALGERAPEDIVAAPRGKRDDEADGAHGVFLSGMSG